ncbi:YndM family protein [Sutcliffiella horikoshii]|uniref:YndM family protein n=1 Tax=Sutcliffiella horikoshii TaxID=79883 RepID=UPI00203A91E7|nr:YndM family protein [Sutcliffiella horikoshii]MCM3617897.1 YndM family protein [Sutcliffiella horikoshii]
MAKLLTAIGIKFVATLGLLYVILGAFGGLSFGSVLLITVVLGMVSYMVGDMLILAKTNNVTATMADLGLAFVLIWLMAASFSDGGIIGTVIIATIGITVFEFFFHEYLLRKVYDGRSSDRVAPHNTEKSYTN